MIIRRVVQAACIHLLACGVASDAQTTNYYLNRRYGATPGIDAELQSLHVVSRTDFTNRPVLAYVHGGGWHRGDKDGVGAKQTYAIEHGYVFASINYRLTTTNLEQNVEFPAHVEDVAAAVAWLYRNIRPMGGAPGQIYLMGHSAGAHLAALVASDPRWLRAHGLSPAVVRAVIANDTGVYDIPYDVDREGKVSALTSSVFGNDPAQWRLASPATYTTAGQAVVPMAILFSAGVNPSEQTAAKRRDRAMHFRALLTDAGVPSVVIDGSRRHDGRLKSHAEINREFGAEGDPVTVQSMNFIEHVSEFSRLLFTRDYPTGTSDTNGARLGGTEIEDLAAHKGMLFAGNGYWKDKTDAQPREWAQVLVKRSGAGAWEEDIGFGRGFLTVESLESVTLTTDGEGKRLVQPVAVLLAGPHHIGTPSRAGVWSRDDGSGAWVETVLATDQRTATGVPRGQVRSIATHVDQTTGVHRVFAGTGCGAVFSGVYDLSLPGRIRWDAKPELPELPPERTRRVHSMAEASRVLYAAVGANGDPSDHVGGLFKRIDGPKPTWEFVCEWDTVRNKHTGLRGLTAVPASPGSSREVLIAGLEATGQILRIDPAAAHAVTVEFDYKAFFTNLWGGLGGAATLSAYNDMTPVVDPRSGRTLHLIGLWVNHPDRQKPPFNGAYYLVRHGDGRYEWARVFDYASPVPKGQQLKACRCIAESPFPEEKARVFYFGGYDAGGASSKHDTAWIYRGAIRGVELPPVKKGEEL